MIEASFGSVVGTGPKGEKGRRRRWCSLNGAMEGEMERRAVGSYQGRGTYGPRNGHAAGAWRSATDGYNVNNPRWDRAVLEEKTDSGVPWGG